ncbi:hypothetical protein TIFTF001_037589 [Ficus carica]|uniref:Uncharacterized protein n=1 Tax=Ficus carica TaxID=3494 RepID=A0AA88EH94_FICCA|nr:hypothetical protein TIFTF001_037589 [Ficus carica]
MRVATPIIWRRRYLLWKQRAKRARNAEKLAEDKAKKAEKRASEAEDARKKAEEARKKAEDDLSTTRSEHSRYLQEFLPAALDQARRQAVEEYQNSVEFNARLLAEYKEGMWDMKAGYAMNNPSVTRVDWSFVPEVSEETASEEGPVLQKGVEEGEMTGCNN